MLTWKLRGTTYSLSFGERTITRWRLERESWRGPLSPRQRDAMPRASKAEARARTKARACLETWLAGINTGGHDVTLKEIQDAYSVMLDHYREEESNA